MKARKIKLLATSIGAVALLLCGQARPATRMPALPQASLMAAPFAQSPQGAAMLVATLNGGRAKYGLDQDHGYVLTVQHPGAAGTRISRLAHTYKGVRVFQSESVIVTDLAGTIISESVSDRRSGLGRGSAANGLGGRYANFDVLPALSARAAIDTMARSAAPAAAYEAPPSAELVIYPVVKRVRVPSAIAKREWQLNAMDLADQVSGYELAYLVKARLVSNDRPLYRDAIVSASDGRVIAQWDALETVTGAGNSQYNGQVPISIMLSGSTYLMTDPLRATGGVYGANTITNANHGSTAGAVYTNSSSTWGDGQNYIAGGSTTNANGQTAAVNAMWGLMNTYDTLKNVLGWHSLDGNNTATYIAAHVYNNYDNAFYNDSCRCMFIGDGGAYFYSLGSIDIIGHEMGHGVTAATSNLTYSGESGGLNESSSDINGEMTEAYARAGGTGTLVPATGNDWMIAKEIGKNGNPLRWMYKPSKDGSSPDAWSSTLGNLDVHYSSGPNNRMFYFLSQGSSSDSTSERFSPFLTRLPHAMSGIGNDKAYRIWFRALTTKFTSATNYADARNKALAAAQELYGVGSREAIAVQRAYAAINVGADIDESTIGGPVLIAAQPQNLAVLAGTTATFAVRADGGTQPYKYQWLRNGVNINGATAASYSFTAQTGDNGVRFSVRVSDSAVPSSAATSSAATLTVAAAPPAERMVNGSFELSETGWAGNTGVISSWVTTGRVPYDGRFFAYLGGNGWASKETLTQTVAIPASAISARLSFALHVDTNEFTRYIAYDKLVVSVKNQAGLVLGTLATYSNLDAATGYQIRAFDLLPYKGQTVTLSFAESEDYSFQTSFTLDKVSLVTQ